MSTPPPYEAEDYHPLGCDCPECWEAPADSESEPSAPTEPGESLTSDDVTAYRPAP